MPVFRNRRGKGYTTEPKNQTRAWSDKILDEKQVGSASSERDLNNPEAGFIFIRDLRC
jgi:hypothetical protein